MMIIGKHPFASEVEPPKMVPFEAII